MINSRDGPSIHPPFHFSNLAQMKILKEKVLQVRNFSTDLTSQMLSSIHGKSTDGIGKWQEKSWFIWKPE
jgi:hypothetical protein